MGQIVVGIAEGKIAKGSDTLISYALGSCVGICLYDRKNRVAGMAHILLPRGEKILQGDNLYKYADTGIPRLIAMMQRRGAEKHLLAAKIAGGAEMFRHECQLLDIGKKNVLAVRETLAKEHIRIVAEETGKDYGRTVVFSAKDGSMEIRMVNRKIIVL